MPGARQLSVTELLYRLSLEHQARLFMVIGAGLETQPPYLNIGNLDSFVGGYAKGLGATSMEAFFMWMRDEAKAFPQEGWARHFLLETQGDHEAAIGRLFTHLHRYLLDARPDWFVLFNREPQQSLFANGFGTPASLDVRNADHVRALTGLSPTSPPDIRVSGFEMGDRYNLVLGLPAGVASWWAGAGRRVVWVAHDAALEAVRGQREPPAELMARARQVAGPEVIACFVDTNTSAAHVTCGRHAGAVHVRAGELVSVAQADDSSTWQMRSGDTVMLLSKPLLDEAIRLGVGPLPPDLATASPGAWAQSIKGAGRRVAVAIAWPR